jgi:hypothetical protein
LLSLCPTHSNDHICSTGYAHAKKVCSASAAGDHTPGGSASEMLAVIPVLRKFLIDVAGPSGRCPAEVKSALLLVRVVELLTLANSGGTTPLALQEL